MASVVAATDGWKIEIVNVLISTASWCCQNDGSSNAPSPGSAERLMRNFERHAATVPAFVRLAMIRLMLKRLTKPTPCS
jgi:hypothetical protein